MLTKQQIDAYLSRIRFTPPASGRAADLANLRALQRAHLMSVPYETLDIMEGRPLDLSADALFDKIVTRRRGGYCFELNELFCVLLLSLGYRTERHFARYLRGEAEIPMRRHEVLTVELPEGVYLCDVGVGAEIPLWPVRVSAEPQKQERGTWACREDPVLGTVLCELTDGRAEDVFAFTPEKTFPVDFLATSYYCETSPDSVFRKELMCAIRTPTGRISVKGDEFHFHRDGPPEIIRPKDPDEFNELLFRYFGLSPDRA